MISFSRIFYFGKITGGVLLDPRFSATKQYGVLGLPMAFILDREGIVRERVLGQVEICNILKKWWKIYFEDLKKVDGGKELNL